MVKKARSSAKQSASKAGAPVPAAEQQLSNAQLPASSSHDAAEARSNYAALGTSERPARIYADGIYDLFHFGHARSLEQAKRLFPHTYLMVGCCNDAVTHKYKGKTVFTEEERYESLRHCKWVDEVIPDAPWVVTPEFLEQHNIDFVAHDDLPYADASGACDDVYGPVKRMGKFMATQRTEGVSTSDIILRILKDYNEYVLRNLSRGYSRKDLGISLVKEQRIRVSNNIRQLSERLKEQRLRVADRITKRVLGNRPTQQRLLVAAAAAANGANGERTGMPRSGSNPSLMGLPAEVLEARRHELADLIRRNGEEFAQNVETVVEKVMLGEYGKEVTQAAEQLTQHVDRFVSGSIRQFEEGYSKLESALRSGFAKKQKGGAKVPRGAVAAAVGNAMNLDSSGPESSG